MSEAAWLSVVGIGEDGIAGLAAEARRRIEAAQVLVGGRRHLALVPPGDAERITWGSPIAATVARLGSFRGRPTVVLASGDPLWFGIGRLILRHVPLEEVVFLPHPSAFQLACARLGWALEEVVTASLHGRPLTGIRRHLAPGARLLLLTGGGDAPAAIARLLEEEGLGGARMTVLFHLGGSREGRWSGAVLEARGRSFAKLNLVALEIPGESALPRAALTPGRGEALFAHDGNITKAEVRAITLAALAPQPGELLWDVGAGSGSVAVEWLRAGPGMRAAAIERRPERAARIRENAARFGVPELEVIEGEAPAALPGGAAPDAIFLGGGLAAPGLLDACFVRLRRGGRLVANAVTPRGEAALLRFHEAHGGELVRIQIARSGSRAEGRPWQASAPVTQLRVVRPR